METKYILSFYAKVEKIKLEKRKWWKIFSNDKIIKYKVWERVILNLNKKESAFILSSNLNDCTEVITIFHKLLLSLNIFEYTGIQLEEQLTTTNYIETNST